MVTPDEVLKRVADEDASQRDELEKTIDERLLAVFGRWGDGWVIVGLRSGIRSRVIEAVKQRYKDAGWEVQEHQAQDQRDDNYLRFRPAK